MSLAAARAAEEQRISLNPYTITYDVYSYVDNGYGKMVKDSVASSASNTVRIAFERRPLRDVTNDNTPVTYQRVMYLVSRYNEEIPQDVTFTYNGQTFKTRGSEPIHFFGGIVRRRNLLDEVTQ